MFFLRSYSFFFGCCSGNGLSFLYEYLKNAYPIAATAMMQRYQCSLILSKIKRLKYKGFRLNLELQTRLIQIFLKSFKIMQALNQNTTIKLSIEHNISSMKVLEARYDLNQTILAVKENIETRYGSLVPFIRLQLKDVKGNLVAEMNDDLRTLGSYGAQTDMVLYVLDLNPSSILKEIESYEGVQKYVISEQDYDKLPQTFRKWKQQFLKNNPQYGQQKKVINIDDKDPEYLSQLASSIAVGSRCKLGSGARGEVKFVGKIMDLGQGYFVGVKLDEPFGNSNGVVKGVKYFEAGDKFGIFVRPNSLEIGDFPELEIDDQI